MRVFVRTCVLALYLAMLGSTAVQGFLHGLALRHALQHTSLDMSGRRIDYGAGYDPQNRPVLVHAPAVRPKIEYGAQYDPHNRPLPLSMEPAAPRPKIEYGSGYDPRNRPSQSRASECDTEPVTRQLHDREASALCKGVLVLKICVDFARDDDGGVSPGRGVEYGMSFYDPATGQGRGV